MAAQLADAPGVELRYGTEWVSSTQDADGVTSVVRDVASGDRDAREAATMLDE